MRWIQDSGLYYLQFPALADLPDFFHGIFPRSALNTGKRDASFNIGLNCGDPESLVHQNRERMLNCFGRPLGVFARQVHGADVCVVDRSALSTEQRHIRVNGDALATAQRQQALIIQVADCQAVMIADPVKRVAANVHSGWRGSIDNIVGRTIDTLVTRLGSRPQHLIAAIGPSLGPCCAQFVNYRKEIPRRYWNYRRAGDLFDFWRLSLDQLTEAGVPPAAVTVAGICTRCNQHLFFSYRGRKKTGRFAAVIGIQRKESQ
jgi:YfiH family protein